METFRNIIPLLHEIVLDFTIVFLDTLKQLRKLPTRLVSPLREHWRRVQTQLPARPKIPTVPLPKAPRFLNHYVALLQSIYVELEDAMEKGFVPLFFIVATIGTILLGIFVFYRALVF